MTPTAPAGAAARPPPAPRGPATSIEALRPTRHAVLRIPGGAPLGPAVAEAAWAAGMAHASVTLLGGWLERAVLHTASPAGTAQAVEYGPPIELQGGAWIFAGSGTLGRAADGAALLHCHAGLVGASGRILGGHVSPHLSVTGRSGIRVFAAAAADVGFSQRHDPGTRFDLFLPVPVFEEDGA